MKSKHIRWISILGMATIIAIVFFQVIWLSRTYRTQQQENTQAISLALFAVARQMAEFNQTTFPNENPVVHLSPTYYVVNINDIIDPGVLDHYLYTEFSHRGLDFRYEYAIYDCATDKMVYAGTSEDDHFQKESSAAQEFPQLPEFTYYFGIHFPDLPKETARDMAFWIFSSFILFLALAFFAYAIFVIFKQKRLSEIQRDFVNTMTHEFKTPIATLKIAADVLRREDLLSDQARLDQYGSIILEQTTILQTHVETVLEAASMEGSRLKLHPEPCDPDLILESQIIPSYEAQIKARKGSIQKKLASEPRHRVLADQKHLKGLLHNILDNACKFAGEPPLIHIESLWKNGHYLLRIRDNGPGIPSGQKRRIFKKYYRITGREVAPYRGFGLGLFYVKKVARAHHWKISAGNHPQGGALFSLQIPKNKS
jgi:two-component system phosphate regulon sensor histidine kinase PhoR